MLFTLMKAVQPVDVHSGYDFPWNPWNCLPLTAPASHHDFHHTHNIGNYSSFFTIFDFLFGSYKQFLKHSEEIEKTSLNKFS